MIEAESALRLMNLLESGRSGTPVFSWKDDEDKDDKQQSIYQKLFGNADVATAPIDIWQAKKHEGYDGKTIGILPVVGTMMKEDYCGWLGTGSLRNELSKMRASASIKSIIMLMDSPGGTVDGTQALSEDFAEAGKQLDTVTVIDGMMCSAGYWAGSSAGKIVATSRTDIIGSIGTMIAFYDNRKAYEEYGLVLREFYATKSKDKNKDFREARDGDGKLIVETLLDPLNDIFLSSVKANRGDKLNEKQTLTGKTFLAEEAKELGLIDEIGSMNQVIQTLLKKHKNPSYMSASKWPNLRKFFGFKDTDDVKLSSEQNDKVEEVITENESLKTKVTGLESQVQTLTTEKTTLETKVTGLESDKTALQTKVDGLQTKVEELGKLDGGKFTSTGAQEEKKTEEATELSASQKELNEKANKL